MKIQKLEAVRGFVAVYIVFHHIIAFNKLQINHPVLKLIFMHPQEAVLVFFLLSGFVIYLSAIKSQHLSFYNYIKKRFVRIYPITMAAFAISTLIFMYNGYQFTTPDIKVLAGNFFMLQDDQAQPGLIVPVYLKNFPLWSLSYEWWFYVMFFPLFVYLRKKQFNTALPHVYLVGIISLIGWFSFLIFPNHVSLVVTYFLLWWTGVACANIYTRYHDFTLKNLTPIFISLLGLCSAISIPVINGLVFNHESLAQVNASYPISTYLHYYVDTVLVLAIGVLWWKYRLKGFDFLFNQWRVFAPISFAIYIVHFPFLWLNLNWIHNFYAEYAVKLVLIFLTSYLLEIKVQPLVNKLFNNKIKAKNKMLENQAY